MAKVNFEWCFFNPHISDILIVEPDSADVGIGERMLIDENHIYVNKLGFDGAFQPFLSATELGQSQTVKAQFSKWSSLLQFRQFSVESGPLICRLWLTQFHPNYLHKRSSRITWFSLNPES